MPQRTNPAAVFASFVLALLLTLVLPVVVLAFNTGLVIFNQDLMTRVATETLVESDFVVGMLEWYSDTRADQLRENNLAATDQDEVDIVELLAVIDANQWRDIKAEVLDDELLTSWVTPTLDGMYTWLDSDDRLPQFSFDIQGLKANVNGEGGKNAILIACQSLPICTEDQINNYHESLQEIVDGVPDDFSVVNQLVEDDVTTVDSAPIATLKQTLRRIRLLSRLGLLLPVLLALLIFVIAGRTIRRAGYWIGIPLLLGSLPTLVLAIAYRTLISSALDIVPSDAVPPFAISEASSTITRFAQEIFQPMLYETLLILSLGVALIVITAVSRRNIAPTGSSV